jgi:hypothetical protein
MLHLTLDMVPAVEIEDHFQERAVALLEKAG